MQHGVEERDVAARLELQDVTGVARDALVLAARIHDDQLGAALGGILQIGRGDRVVLGRARTNDDDAVGVLGSCERRGDGSRVQPFHQRRDRGGVAQPRAVVDIVGAEALTHELLEEIGLLVGALGRAEARHTLAALTVTDALESACGALQRLVPRRLTEILGHLVALDLQIGVLGHAVTPDQRLGQAIGVMNVIKAEAALDAQAVLVGGPVAAVDRDDAVTLDVHFGLAADAAIGAEGVD